MKANCVPCCWWFLQWPVNNVKLSFTAKKAIFYRLKNNQNMILFRRRKKHEANVKRGTNGGQVYLYAYCVACGTEFKATKPWQGVEYVMELGRQHCWDENGGPSSGHLYKVLY